MLVRIKRLFLIFLLWFVVQGTYAQNNGMTDSLGLSYEYLTSLRTPAAKKILSSLSLDEQKFFWVPYQENYVDFIEVFISEDKNLYDSIQPLISSRYNQVEALSEQNPYRLWMLANMNLQWALVSAKFGQYFQTGWNLNKAYRQITQNHELFPDFAPNDLTLGVLHTIVGLIPDQYRWVLKIVSMQGTVSQGEKEIYNALQQSLKNPDYSFLKNESMFLTGIITLSLSPEHQGVNKIKVEIDKVGTQNLLIDYLKAEILIKTGKNDEAFSLLNKMLLLKGYYPFYFLDYLKGDCLIKRLDTTSDSYYQIFLKNFHGVNYIKDAWRKRGWAALLKGDTLGYFRMMDSVLVRGNKMVDADKQAYQEAQSNKVPNLMLLKSRLLFDGGYFEKSKNVLIASSQMALTKDEKLERTYRYGRIAQNLKNWPEAKEKYRQTIDEGRYSTLYFAGNSALKLGEIYEVQDSLQHAAFYYNLCLQLNFKQYRNGIRGVAKESLSRVQKALNY
ncbi:MAG: hypothetical protein JXR65_02120 [Bacteroidales bacterium]|nr:hypothetical protein [Bacteroidales bacterium]